MPDLTVVAIAHDWDTRTELCCWLWVRRDPDSGALVGTLHEITGHETEDGPAGKRPGRELARLSEETAAGLLRAMTDAAGGLRLPVR